MSMTPEQQAALLAAMKKKIKIWKAAASIQIASSTISFVSSSALAVMIWRKKDRFATPYRRIIFCISISDILQSLGLLIGPFSPPKSVRQAIWSVGNDNTCTFDGLLFTFGSTWVPMYSAALSIYYFCKLHLNMTDEQFQFKVERHMHRFIILSMIAVNIAAMAKDAINTATSGTVCLYSATPIRCRYTDNVDCDANADAAMVIGMMTTTIMPFLCLFLILAFLSKLSYEIAFREKLFSSSNISPPASTQDEEMAESQQINVGKEEEAKVQSNDDASGKLRKTSSGKEQLQLRSTTSNRRKMIVQQRLAKSYKREMMLQVLLYSLAFMATYVLFAVGNLMFYLEKQPPLVFFFFIQALFPLGGIFNILIFTRPATKVEKTRSPHLSWLGAFWIVFKNGGDPTPATVARPTTGSQIDNDAGGDSKSYFNDKSLKFGVAKDLNPSQKAPSDALQEYSNIYNDISQDAPRLSVAQESLNPSQKAPSDALQEYSNIYNDISQDAPRLSDAQESADPVTSKRNYCGNLIDPSTGSSHRVKFCTGNRFFVSSVESEGRKGESYDDISEYAPISQVQRDATESQENTQTLRDASDNKPNPFTKE